MEHKNNLDKMSDAYKNLVLRNMKMTLGKTDRGARAQRRQAERKARRRAKREARRK